MMITEATLRENNMIPIEELDDDEEEITPTGHPLMGAWVASTPTIKKSCKTKEEYFAKAMIQFYNMEDATYLNNPEEVLYWSKHDHPLKKYDAKCRTARMYVKAYTMDIDNGVPWSTALISIKLSALLDGVDVQSPNSLYQIIDVAISEAPKVKGDKLLLKIYKRLYKTFEHEAGSMFS